MGFRGLEFQIERVRFACNTMKACKHKTKKHSDPLGETQILDPRLGDVNKV